MEREAGVAQVKQMTVTGRGGGKGLESLLINFGVKQLVCISLKLRPPPPEVNVN